jgi:hypothetical protein
MDSIFPFLLFHEPFQTVLTNKLAVLHKARLIPFVVTFFKVFNQLARIIGTFKTIGQPFALDTIFYLAFAAVFRFAHVAVQATGTRLFMITMLIADQTVHAAGGKHSRIHFFCWHFHGSPSLSAYGFFHSTTIPRAWK